MLLAVFNDGAMIALSKDRVVASRMPNSWHLGAIFGQGVPRFLIYLKKDPCSACFLNIISLAAALWHTHALRGAG